MGVFLFDFIVVQPVVKLSSSTTPTQSTSSTHANHNGPPSANTTLFTIAASTSKKEISLAGQTKLDEAVFAFLLDVTILYGLFSPAFG
jgi:hypothetical protein